MTHSRAVPHPHEPVRMAAYPIRTLRGGRAREGRRAAVRGRAVSAVRNADDPALGAACGRHCEPDPVVTSVFTLVAEVRD